MPPGARTRPTRFFFGSHVIMRENVNLSVFDFDSDEDDVAAFSWIRKCIFGRYDKKNQTQGYFDSYFRLHGIKSVYCFVLEMGFGTSETFCLYPSDWHELMVSPPRQAFPRDHFKLLSIVDDWLHQIAASGEISILLEEPWNQFQRSAQRHKIGKDPAFHDFLLLDADDESTIIPDDDIFDGFFKGNETEEIASSCVKMEDDLAS